MVLVSKWSVLCRPLQIWSTCHQSFRPILFSLNKRFLNQNQLRLYRKRTIYSLHWTFQRYKSRINVFMNSFIQLCCSIVVIRVIILYRLFELFLSLMGALNHSHLWSEKYLKCPFEKILFMKLFDTFVQNVGNHIKQREWVKYAGRIRSLGNYNIFTYIWELFASYLFRGLVFYDV